MILTLDPGKNGCGLGWGHNKVLLGATYVRNENKQLDAYDNASHLARELVSVVSLIKTFPPYSRIERLVIEHPRIYFGSQKGNDKNDLFALVAVGAAFVEHMRLHEGQTKQNWGVKIVTVYPAQWKGQVKKEVMTERIKKRLTPTEDAGVVKFGKTLDHNTYDAVGIFLWDAGRL